MKQDKRILLEHLDCFRDLKINIISSKTQPVGIRKTSDKLSTFVCYSVLTPHLKEEVKFSTKELNESEDNVAIGFYMQRIYPGTCS